MSEEELPEGWGVHITHCCPVHGCKYESIEVTKETSECPVFKGLVEREKNSGWCQEPHLVDDPEACRKPGEHMPATKEQLAQWDRDYEAEKQRQKEEIDALLKHEEEGDDAPLDVGFMERLGGDYPASPPFSDPVPDSISVEETVELMGADPERVYPVGDRNVLVGAPDKTLEMFRRRHEKREPVEHELKTWPAEFRAMKSGEKTFDVRKNDRDFEKGDILVLKEWNPGTTGAGVTADETYFGPPDQGYTGNVLRMKVAYILRGPIYSIPKDVVVMSVVPEKKKMFDVFDAVQAVDELEFEANKVLGSIDDKDNWPKTTRDRVRKIFQGVDGLLQKIRSLQFEMRRL